MSFVSVQFFLFLPIVLVVYYLLPHKWRWIWLLVSSYFFYINWNPSYALLMMLSTLITFYSSKFIERSNDPVKRNYLLGISLISNLSILFFFKYFNFLNESIKVMYASLGWSYQIPNVDVLLPVGISFYTFQALSYSLDVFFKRTTTVDHLGKYALFVSFFPQLVAGPIERSSHLIPQFSKKVFFQLDAIKRGGGLILIGIFKKIIIADRFAVIVNTVYASPENHDGIELWLATVLFAFQIFCDFSAYTDIARGSARLLGFDLMQNFSMPYLAQSIPDFWRRWHISLTTWFRDYVYIPLGGNRVSKIKWYRNILIVFLISGLWHGAAWTYVIWGLLHGLYQAIDLYTKKRRDQLNALFSINPSSWWIGCVKVVWTFTLVCLAWVFFRANSIDQAFYMLEEMLNVNSWNTARIKVYDLGLDEPDFIAGVVGVLLLFVFWRMKLTKDVYSWWNLKAPFIKYLLVLIFVWILVVFGYYGPQYTASSFIYFQF